MVFQCCVRGCNTIAKSGLHSFPSKQSLAEKWILAIKAFDLINDLENNKLARLYRKVCKKHFRECDFVPNVDGKSQLAKDSVPSIFLPEKAEVNKQIPTKLQIQCKHYFPINF